MVTDARFPNIWCQQTPPRASFAAYRDRTTGELAIVNGRVTFRHPEGSCAIEGVLRVEAGRFGSDFFNRWVMVEYGKGEHRSALYFKDGEWLGWRPILTGSNRRIARALRNLLE